MSFFFRRKMFARHYRQRQTLGVLAVLLVLLAGSAYVAGQTLFSSSAPSPSHRAPAAAHEEANSKGASPKKQAAPERSAPGPEQDTPEAAAYVVLAPELPGVSPGSIKSVFRSKLDPSWASVRVEPSGEAKAFVVFTHFDGKSWKAEKSMRADEPNYPKNDVVPLTGVPKDLIEYLYPENVFAAKVPEPRKLEMKLDDLPHAGPAHFPAPDPVADDVPDSDRERVKKVLEKVRQEIKSYNGVAGLYVEDLDGGYGYGVRPDEEFFTASIIKVPIMVAVYRKVDEGELSFSQEIEIKDEDWAAGAGWLQWEKPGTKQTVGDLLLLMMTQSDNVAANALVRTVGGADRVNEVARSLGARNTLLYQKVSSERGAVPALDNRSTPRDMATMLQKIADGEAASEKSCGYMIDLMHQDQLDWWLDAGLPANVDAANKAGWLYKVYDEVGIVENGGNRYVIAILSKHGTNNVYGGEALIKNLSKTVWESQSGS